MRRSLITLVAVLSMGLAGTAMAQRGGGHGGNGQFKPRFCKIGPRVQLKAYKLKDSAVALRRAVRNLPRPGKWLPVTRPVVQETRQIVRKLNNPERGICFRLIDDIRDAKRAIRKFKRKLRLEGRGPRAAKLNQKLNVIRNKLNRFEEALDFGPQRRW